MNVATITLDLPGHGTHTVTTGALHHAIARYLPASIHSLRNLAAERGAVDYGDVHDIATLLIVLADFDHNVDGDPLATAEHRQPTWRGIPLDFPNGTPDLYGTSDDDTWFAGYALDLQHHDGSTTSFVACCEARPGVLHGHRFDDDRGEPTLEEINVPLADVARIEIP
jgi:hypothetical protein